MTLGNKIKSLRNTLKLTQKQLADTLHIESSLISKWENDSIEPDLGNIKKLSKLFNVSTDYLLNDNEEENNDVLVANLVAADIDEKPKNKVVKKSTSSKKEVSQSISIGTCYKCGKTLFEDDKSHRVQIENDNGSFESYLLCDDCYNSNGVKKTKKKTQSSTNKKELDSKDKGKKNKKDKPKLWDSIKDRDDSKVLIWSLILAAAAFIATLVICIINFKSFGIWLTIGLPFAVFYIALADIYCLFSNSFIGDVFLEVASWSIKFPSIIFTLDLDGIAFLIVMKILFAIIGFLAGCACLALAFVIATLLSVFAFIPIVVSKSVKKD